MVVWPGGVHCPYLIQSVRSPSLRHDRTSSRPPNDLSRHCSFSGRSIRIGWRPHAAIALTVGGLLVVPLALSPTADATTAPTSAEPGYATQPLADVTPATTGKIHPRFPGHRPGRIYLGMSCGEMCPQKESQLGQRIGLKRWFKKWGNWQGVAGAIQEDRRKHRLPWISIEGPSGGTPTGWRDVGRGQYDRDIRGLARVLKANDQKPLFISFDHEMSNNAPDSQGRLWARGFIRFYDVLKRSHALRNVAVPPIFVSWLFDRDNGQNPSSWLPPGVLRRASFMGIDVYQNESGKAFGGRIPQVDRWLARHGHPNMMVGLGETGGTSSFGNVSGATWLDRSLRWSARHPGTVAAISYFNSTANSGPNLYWPLDESARKLNVYRKWLGNPRFISRVR